MTIHAHIQSATIAAPPPEFRANQQKNSVCPERVEGPSFSPGGMSSGVAKDRTSPGSAKTDDAEQHFRTALSILETTHTDATQGWTPQRQSQFLSAIADGATVQDAAKEVGLSRRSAYAFRRTARGTAFKYGWQAADILATDSLREDLWDRARHGQSWTTVREDGERTITTTRHRFDNRLALSMLTRLEARVEEGVQTIATRLANRFDDYLGVLEAGDAPANLAELLARVTPPPLDIGTCEPCESDAADAVENPVLWWNSDSDDWETNLPPPLDFDGEEYGRRHDGDYSRTLTDEEQEDVAHFAPEACELPLHPLEIAAQAERTAWFTAARGVAHPRDVVVDDGTAGGAPDPSSGTDQPT